MALTYNGIKQIKGIHSEILLMFEGNGATMTPFTNPVILNSSHLLFSQEKGSFYAKCGFTSDLKL